MEKIQRTIWIPPQVWTAAKIRAAQTGSSMSAKCEEALRAWAEESESGRAALRGKNDGQEDSSRA